jgi:hypothetical protein
MRLRMIHSVLYAERRATMPRPPQTKALEEALEQLQAAREVFAQAFEGILSQLDLRPIAQALADWRQAAEALQDEVQTVYDDASAYFDARSDTGQESDKGQAFPMWVTELEELANFNPEPIDTVRIASDLAGAIPVTDMASNPSEALPELPEMPA